MDAPNEFQPLIDEIFCDKVRWARQETPERKFVDGLNLFEDVVVRMRGGIRAQFPELSGEAVEAELYRRFARLRQVQEHGFYSPTPPL